MKKIINGRLYDTGTAKEIGCYENGYGAGDFRYYYESLYSIMENCILHQSADCFRLFAEHSKFFCGLILNLQKK